MIDDSLNERATYSSLEEGTNHKSQVEKSLDSFNDRAEEYDNSVEFSVEENKSYDSLNFEEKSYIEQIKS